MKPWAVVFESFATASLALWGELEGFFLVVSPLAFDHTVEDSRQLVSGGGDSFAIAEFAFYTPHSGAHLGL